MDGHKKIPSSCLLYVEREKKTKNIRFSIGIDEGHSQLAWEASQLAKPARSLKLFGTFLTFFSAIHFFLTVFSHFVWTHLLAWFEFAPCTAGQLQLSSWLTTPVDDVPPPSSWLLLLLALSSAGCFIIWADEINWKTFEIRLGSSGTYNFLQNWILNSARATQRKQSAVAEWLVGEEVRGGAEQACLMWLGNDLPFIMYFSCCCCIFLIHYDT